MLRLSILKLMTQSGTVVCCKLMAMKWILSRRDGEMNDSGL